MESRLNQYYHIKFKTAQILKKLKYSNNLKEYKPTKIILQRTNKHKLNIQTKKRKYKYNQKKEELKCHQNNYQLYLLINQLIHRKLNIRLIGSH